MRDGEDVGLGEGDGKHTQHTITVQLEGVADDGRASAYQTDHRKGPNEHGRTEERVNGWMDG